MALDVFLLAGDLRVLLSFTDQTISLPTTFFLCKVLLDFAEPNVSFIFLFLRSLLYTQMPYLYGPHCFLY